MNTGSPKHLLVFHIGSLGDTLVAVPALWAIRENFPGAHLTMLTDYQVGKKYISPQDVLSGSGLIDEFLCYPFEGSYSGKILQPLRMLRLLAVLRSNRYEALVYLIRENQNDRTPRIGRDLKFFRLAGIRQFIGTKGFLFSPNRRLKKSPSRVPPIGDQLLSRLAASNIVVPEAGNGYAHVNILPEEKKKVKEWRNSLAADKGRSWVAIGPGTKMPSKRWPVERYARVGKRLIESLDLWPVVFGGSEDRLIGDMLVAHWGRGYVAAGRLNVRESIAAMADCGFYLGNDTGTIHMAASAGLKCVGIYSSRDIPGKWHPYGHGHIILRTAIECEGCMLENCLHKGRQCILSIDEEQVFRACRQIYERHIK